MKVIVLLLLSACGGITSSAPRSPPMSFGSELQAGVARAEITPPPGLAMFGHGPEGRVTRGRRHRLYCRAFVFTQGDEALALLPCDLSEVSLELAREIANLTLPRAPISADRIILSATHTHGGPAHFFGSANYHGPMSSRSYGFDPNVLSWIAQRASAAIVAAYRARRQARVAWAEGKICHLSTNRSIAPFSFNVPDVDDLLTCASTVPERRAIDPSLFTLRVETSGPNGDWRHSGTYSVFGVHGTTVPNTNDLYHGDLFGFAEQMLEKPHGVASGARCLDLRMRETECVSIVAGIANGIEGDITPAYHRQAMSEAQRIGRSLAASIAATKPKHWARSELRRLYRELRMPSAELSTGRLCDHPSLGISAGGGSEGGLTSLTIFPLINEGAALLPGDKCWSPKVPLYTFCPTGTREFPEIAPITLARIGNGLIASLPLEPTTVTGLRLRKALAREFRADTEVEMFPVVALANSYLQYMATREEYQLQHYEGASTIYGPDSAAFFVESFGCLARRLRGSSEPCRGAHPIGEIVDQEYHPNPVVERLKPSSTCRIDEIRSEALEVEGVKIDAMPGWSFRFRAHAPDDAACWQDLSLEIVDRSGNIVADDVRDDFELRHQTDAWRATWFTTLRSDGLRFRVKLGTAWMLESKEFCTGGCR